MLPITSIVVASDLTQRSTAALARAISLKEQLGAHLTVLLDACHSGSGVRGRRRSRVRQRSVRRDERDVADGASSGPPPEDRGALVLSAAQDYDRAWEMRDDRGRMQWRPLFAQIDFDDLLRVVPGTAGIGHEDRLV